MAKYTWSLVAMVAGADCRPNSFDQFWLWARRYIPAGKKLYMVGLAAICWALWKARNAMCFEDKKIRSPTEIICMACPFLLFWTELQTGDSGKMLEEGAEALKATTLHYHPQEATQDDTGAVLLQ